MTNLSRLAPPLVVEDDPAQVEYYQSVLEEAGMQPVAAQSIAAARQLLKRQKFSIALVDVQLPDVAASS